MEVFFLNKSQIKETFAEEGLVIWILARHSHKQRLDILIESLLCLEWKYGKISIHVLSNIAPTMRQGITYWNNGSWHVICEKSVHNSIVLVDQIIRSDLEIIQYLEKQEMPMIIEKKIVDKFSNHLRGLEGRMNYSYFHPERLAVIIPRLLREYNIHPVVACSELTNITLPHKPDQLLKSNIQTRKDNVILADVEEIDLVIINYNTLEYLKECISSIREYTKYTYNLIIVDNGSTDGSLRYLKKITGITLIENRENLGYARACNQGIMAGRAEFIVILNSDIRVYPGWLTSMVNVAKSDEQIGVVGPKMVNDKGQITGAGVTKLDDLCGSRGFGLEDSEELFGVTEDCISVGGACYMIRREALRKVGGFDERFFFYYEETDLSLRMLEKGYRVVYTPNSKILHYHEGSLDPQKPQERVVRNQFFEKSRQYFIKKWQEVLTGAEMRKHPRDIVVFGIIPWHFRYQRPQQFCTRLADQGYRILYINNICQIHGSVEKVHDNIYVFNPVGLGVVYNNLGFNQQKELVASIYRAFTELEIYNPILWVDVPYWLDVIEHFDREMVIYNCMDSYNDFSDIQQYCTNVEDKEVQLCKEADLVLASSKLLYDKLIKYSDNVRFIPNGVDTSHFMTWSELPLPEDLQDIPQPIIGYYGAIAEWMDLDLLTFIVERMPKHSFVFIGQPTVDVKHLQNKPNVYFLGEKSYWDLPKYLHQFKIALIPFKKNRLSLSTNPVKLYEYLAAGKPIVSVDLPEIQEFNDVVYIGKSYEEFLFLLEQIEDHKLGLEKRKRQKAIEGNDWHDRVREILKALAAKQGQLKAQSLINRVRDRLRYGGEK